MRDENRNFKNGFFTYLMQLGITADEGPNPPGCAEGDTDGNTGEPTETSRDDKPLNSKKPGTRI